jgi:hypothetical protein
LYNLCISCDTSYPVLKHKRPIRTLETQSRILLYASVGANHAGSFLILRINVDAIGLEAAARLVGVALDDESFGLREVGKALVVPAGLFETTWLVRTSSRGIRVFDILRWCGSCHRQD